MGIGMKYIGEPYALHISIHSYPYGICLAGLLSCPPWLESSTLILFEFAVVSALPGGQFFFWPSGWRGFGVSSYFKSRRIWVYWWEGTIWCFRCVSLCLPIYPQVRLRGPLGGPLFWWRWLVDLVLYVRVRVVQCLAWHPRPGFPTWRGICLPVSIILKGGLEAHWVWQKIIGFLSLLSLVSSNARHAATSSAWFEELPSSPLPSWQHPHLFSFSLKKPASMTPWLFEPSVA